MLSHVYQHWCGSSLLLSKTVFSGVRCRSGCMMPSGSDQALGLEAFSLEAHSKDELQEQQQRFRKLRLLSLCGCAHEQLCLAYVKHCA